MLQDKNGVVHKVKEIVGRPAKEKDGIRESRTKICHEEEEYVVQKFTNEAILVDLGSQEMCLKQLKEQLGPLGTLHVNSALSI